MFKLHFIRTLICAAIGAAIALLIYTLTPPVFEARAALMVGNAQKTGTSLFTGDIQDILVNGLPQTADTEVQVLRSPSIFAEALIAAFGSETEAVKRFDELYQRYDVVNLGNPSPNIIQLATVAEIQVKAESRETSEKIANQIVFAYNDERKKIGQDNLQRALDVLNKLESTATAQLKKTEKDLEDYRVTNKISDLQVQTVEAEHNRSAYEQSYKNAKAEYESLNASVSTMENEIRNQPTRLQEATTSQRSEKALELDNQIALLKAERANKAQRYTADNEIIRQIDSQIKQLVASRDAMKKTEFKMSSVTEGVNPVRRNLENALADLRVRRDQAQAKMGEFETAWKDSEATLDKFPPIQVKLDQFSRQRLVLDEQVRRLQAQINELKDRNDLGASSAQVVSHARSFPEAVAPQLPKLLLMCIIGGVAVGLIFSFSLETSRSRIHNSSQLAELTGLPVVATVPPIGRGGFRGLRGLVDRGARPQESFRYMVHSMSAKGETNQKVFMFTGIGRTPGRASAALQFAMAMANSGAKVLVVDCDLARKSISKAMNASQSSGLSDMLSGDQLGSVNTSLFVATNHDNLLLLPAGTAAGASLSDLRTSSVSNLLQALRSTADIVVLDVAPCDIVSDASILAQYVDETCLVVSGIRTSFRTIPTAFEILAGAGAQNISLILTDAAAQAEPFSQKAAYLAQGE